MGEEYTGIAPSSELNAAQERLVKNKKDTSNLYGVLILLIVLLVGGAGFFFLQQLRSEQEGLGGALDKGDRRLASLGDQLTALQSLMSTLQSQMATMQNSFATRESKLERELASFQEHQGNRLTAVKAELSDSIANIQDLLNRTRGDWMIADAEYLLSVANQRLNLVGDVKTSLVALQAADERLRDSGNPGVFKVREQVAREINALKNLRPVDIVAVFSKIRILADQIAELPIFLPHSGVVQQEVDKAKPEAKTGEISSVNDFLDSAIEDLKGLVVVRRSDREIDVILQPEEVRVIRQELRLKLEMARLAFLERDSTLFLQNIEEIQNWLAAHFRSDAPETKKFEAELGALKTVGLDIDYPDISGSLKLLENLAALRLETDKYKQTPAPGKPEATEVRVPKPKGAQP
ncbi:MAG: uroporphyrinogen-III C-methyltransferase [Methylococcales bacterium]